MQKYNQPIFCAMSSMLRAFILEKQIKNIFKLHQSLEHEPGQVEVSYKSFIILFYTDELYIFGKLIVGLFLHNNNIINKKINK